MSSFDVSESILSRQGPCLWHGRDALVVGFSFFEAQLLSPLSPKSGPQLSLSYSFRMRVSLYAVGEALLLPHHMFDHQSVALKLSNSHSIPLSLLFLLVSYFVKCQTVQAKAVLIHGITPQFINSEPLTNHTLILCQGLCVPHLPPVGFLITSWVAPGPGPKFHFSLSFIGYFLAPSATI